MNIKKIAFIILFFLAYNSYACGDPVEPEIKKIDTKDLVDKAERPEIEQDNKIEFDENITKFEMPKIDVAKDVKKEPVKKAKPIKHNNSHKITKTTHKKVDKKPTVKKVDKKVVKKSSAKKKLDKNRLVAATRPLTLSQVKEHDKIVFSDGKRNILRRTKTKIIKYPYNYAIPVDSSSLKANADGSFYVINKARFIADSKALKSKKVNKPNKSETKTNDSEELDIAVTAKDREARRLIEEKYNHGKSIKKDIKLKNLRENDEVYIVKGVQFVFRKKKATSGMYKYWLVEKLNPENNAVQKVSKNKYKITKAYLPDS